MAQRNDVGEDNQAKNDDAPTADALERPANQEDAHGVGETADKRANSEGNQRQDQEKRPTEYVAKGSNEGHGDGIGKQVRGADPEPLGCRAIEVDHDVLLQMVRNFADTKRGLGLQPGR